MTKKQREQARSLGILAEFNPNLRCEHTPGQPDGYMQWHAWAERMSKTNRQIKCAFCGLYQVWIPKKLDSSKELPPQ